MLLISHSDTCRDTNYHYYGRWQLGKTLSDRLQNMLNHQLMCDVTFRVGSTQTPIKSHKFMMASASPVFYSMFDGQRTEKGDVSYRILKLTSLTTF